MSGDKAHMGKSPSRGVALPLESTCKLVFLQVPMLNGTEHMFLESAKWSRLTREFDGGDSEISSRISACTGLEFRGGRVISERERGLQKVHVWGN